MNFKGYKKGIIFLALLFISVPLAAKYKNSCPVDNHSFCGTAIGTNFSVILSHTPLTTSQFEDWRREISLLLEQLDNSMSNYIDDSEVSLINRNSGTINFYPISEDLHRVLSASLNAYHETEGYFDITVSPLVDLWGFGSGAPNSTVPTDCDIASVISYIGSDKIILGVEGLRKLDPKVNINLSAIAKGFLVDKIANYLTEKGVDNFMVEIGGEIVAKGKNKDGIGWRIGIETPGYNAEEGVYGVVAVSDGAMATSGDYRRYLKSKGQHYSHIIDPKTGYPAKHSLASVTVMAKNCMQADAYATALFVMGTEKGLRWVEKKEGVEAYFIVRKEDGGFISKGSSGFKIEPVYSSN